MSKDIWPFYLSAPVGAGSCRRIIIRGRRPLLRDVSTYSPFASLSILRSNSSTEFTPLPVRLSFLAASTTACIIANGRRPSSGPCILADFVYKIHLLPSKKCDYPANPLGFPADFPKPRGVFIIVCLFLLHFFFPFLLIHTWSGALRLRSFVDNIVIARHEVPKQSLPMA